MKKYTEIEQKVIDAIGEWEDDWIINVIKTAGGAIQFCINIEVACLDCYNIEITEFEIKGGWISITGWLK